MTGTTIVRPIVTETGLDQAATVAIRLAPAVAGPLPVVIVPPVVIAPPVIVAVPSAIVSLRVARLPITVAGPVATLDAGAVAVRTVPAAGVSAIPVAAWCILPCFGGRLLSFAAELGTLRPFGAHLRIDTDLCRAFGAIRALAPFAAAPLPAFAAVLLLGLRGDRHQHRCGQQGLDNASHGDSTLNPPAHEPAPMMTDI